MKTSAIAVLFSLAVAARAFAADAPPTEVVMLDHTKVAEAFAKGTGLLANSSYKVQAGRRVKPGVVEIHAHDTDIFYVTEGTATFVTGGTPVDPKTTRPGEMLADKVEGGVPHQLTKGDVIVIPAGTPHQFTEVNGTFLYLVIKVTK